MDSATASGFLRPFIRTSLKQGVPEAARRGSRTHFLDGNLEFASQSPCLPSPLRTIAILQMTEIRRQGETCLRVSIPAS
jgi:hypothetical protein